MGKNGNSGTHVARHALRRCGKAPYSSHILLLVKKSDISTIKEEDRYTPPVDTWVLGMAPVQCIGKRTSDIPGFMTRSGSKESAWYLYGGDAPNLPISSAGLRP
jgi:hypothetical protein